MQLPNFKCPHIRCGSLLIAIGIFLLLIFFCSWRALLAIVGFFLLAAGCATLTHH